MQVVICGVLSVIGVVSAGLLNGGHHGSNPYGYNSQTNHPINSQSYQTYGQNYDNSGSRQQIQTFRIIDDTGSAQAYNQISNYGASSSGEYLPPPPPLQPSSSSGHHTGNVNTIQVIQNHVPIQPPPPLPSIGLSAPDYIPPPPPPPPPVHAAPLHSHPIQIQSQAHNHVHTHPVPQNHVQHNHQDHHLHTEARTHTQAYSQGNVPTYTEASPQRFQNQEYLPPQLPLGPPGDVTSVENFQQPAPAIVSSVSQTQAHSQQQYYGPPQVHSSPQFQQDFSTGSGTYHQSSTPVRTQPYLPPPAPPAPLAPLAPPIPSAPIRTQPYLPPPPQGYLPQPADIPVSSGPQNIQYNQVQTSQQYQDDQQLNSYENDDEVSNLQIIEPTPQIHQDEHSQAQANVQTYNQPLLPPLPPAPPSPQAYLPPVPVPVPVQQSYQQQQEQISSSVRHVQNNVPVHHSPSHTEANTGFRSIGNTQSVYSAPVSHNDIKTVRIIQETAPTQTHNQQQYNHNNNINIGSSYSGQQGDFKTVRIINQQNSAPIPIQYHSNNIHSNTQQQDIKTIRIINEGGTNSDTHNHYPIQQTHTDQGAIKTVRIIQSPPSSHHVQQTYNHHQHHSIGGSQQSQQGHVKTLQIIQQAPIAVSNSNHIGSGGSYSQHQHGQIKTIRIIQAAPQTHPVTAAAHSHHHGDFKTIRVVKTPTSHEGNYGLQQPQQSSHSHNGYSKLIRIIKH